MKPHNLSRRTFVKGIVASTALLSGMALSAKESEVKQRRKTTELSGTEFYLTEDTCQCSGRAFIRDNRQWHVAWSDFTLA